MEIMDMLNKVVAIGLSAFSIILWGVAVVMLITGATIIIKSRGSERWAGLVIVVVTLLVLPTMIRDYPPELARAGATSFTNTLPYLQQLNENVSAALSQSLTGSSTVTVNDVATPTPPVYVPPTEDPDIGGGYSTPAAMPDVSPTPTTYYVIVTSTPISIGIPGPTSTALWGTVVANDATRHASEPSPTPLSPTPTLAPTSTTQSAFPGVPNPPTPEITPVAGG